MRVFVTGASGFVGQHLLARLLREGDLRIRGSVRRDGVLPGGVEPATIGDLATLPDLSMAMRDVQSVVHLAARVHVMKDTAENPLAEFRRANVDATLHLARTAVRSGVKRFVFVSSIKVNGERTLAGAPFRASDKPAPADPYGISKFEAERALNALAAETGLEVVVVRPVLIYGPGVRGNFLTLMRILDRGIPLPFGAIMNRRSLLGVANLADLLATSLRHPAAPGRVFLASDGEDLSTPELLRRLASALGRPARLLPFPPGVMSLLARLAGKGETARRVLTSLQVDLTETRNVLAWKPPVGVDAGLGDAADWFRAMRR